MDLEGRSGLTEAAAPVFMATRAGLKLAGFELFEVDEFGGFYSGLLADSHQLGRFEKGSGVRE